MYAKWDRRSIHFILWPFNCHLGAYTHFCASHWPWPPHCCRIWESKCGLCARLYRVAARVNMKVGELLHWRRECVVIAMAGCRAECTRPAQFRAQEKEWRNRFSEMVFSCEFLMVRRRQVHCDWQSSIRHTHGLCGTIAGLALAQDPRPNTESKRNRNKWMDVIACARHN